MDADARMENLKRANVIRARRSQLRKDIAKMETTEACRLLAQRLVDDPESIGTLKVEQMLLAIRDIGPRAANQMARAAKDTSLVERIDRLPEFRRRELSSVLLDHAHGLERREKVA